MLFGTVDQIIVGKFLGTRALAALGSTSPLITFVSSVFWGYAVGFSIYEAKLFGAGEYKKLKSVFYSNVIFYFVFSASVCVGLVLFHDWIFTLLKIDESLKKLAFEYFSVYASGLFLIAATVIGSHTLTALGISGYPLCISIVSAVINLVGNVLSAIVFDWGLWGIATFSVFSAFVAIVFYYIKIRKCFQEMGVGKEKTEVKFSYVKKAFPYALPNTLQQTLMYLAGLAVSPIVNGLGVAASASYAVVTSVQNISAQVYQNSSRCVANYTAQCVGEKEYGKIKRGVFAGLLQSVAFGFPFIVGCTLLAKPVCGLFFKANADALTKEYSYLFVERYLPFIFFNLICNLFHALFKGVKAPVHLISGTFVATASRIGLSYLLLKKGIEGFYLAWVLSWIIEAAFVVALYFIGFWRPDRKKNI